MFRVSKIKSREVAIDTASLSESFSQGSVAEAVARQLRTRFRRARGRYVVLRIGFVVHLLRLTGYHIYR